MERLPIRRLVDVFPGIMQEVKSRVARERFQPLGLFDFLILWDENQNSHTGWASKFHWLIKMELMPFINMPCYFDSPDCLLHG